MLLFLLLLLGWSRLVLDVDLVRGENAPDAIDEGESVVLGPKVNVKRMKLVVVYVLVSGIVGG